MSVVLFTLPLYLGVATAVGDVVGHSGRVLSRYRLRVRLFSRRVGVRKEAGIELVLHLSTWYLYSELGGEQEGTGQLHDSWCRSEGEGEDK